MPTVICEACGVDFHWRNTRGSKIPRKMGYGRGHIVSLGPLSGTTD